MGGLGMMESFGIEGLEMMENLGVLEGLQVMGVLEVTEEAMESLRMRVLGTRCLEMMRGLGSDGRLGDGGGPSAGLGIRGPLPGVSGGCRAQPSCPAWSAGMGQVCRGAGCWGLGEHGWVQQPEVQGAAGQPSTCVPRCWPRA